MQRDDTAIQLAQDTALAEEEDAEIPNSTATDDIKAIPSLDLRKLSKNTKTFEMQNVKSKAFQIHKRSKIFHSRTGPSLEHGEGTSGLCTKSNKPNRKKLISNISKKHEQYKTLNRKQASCFKLIEAETSETEDDNSSSAVRQEYPSDRMPRKQKTALSDDTSTKPLGLGNDTNSKGSNLESKNPKEIKKVQLRGIETTSPDLNKEAPGKTGSLSNRKSEMPKLLSCTSKKQTKKKTPMLSKQYAGSSREADNSDFEDIELDSAKNLYKSSALEPPRQELTHSPELGHGTPEPLRPKKLMITNRMKRYQNLLKKNKLKRATRKNIASPSKATQDESSETSEFEYQEKRDSQLTKLSEATPEPIQQKRWRPLRMTLLSTVPKKYKGKKMSKEKVETSELDQSDMDVVPVSFPNLTTPEPRNDSDLSQSDDLSESTQKPINLSKRSHRIKLKPAYGRPAIMRMPSKERKDKMKLFDSQNSSTQWRTNSNLPSEPTTSAKAQAQSARSSINLEPKAPIKSDSPAQILRTRVLVTPERKEKNNTLKKNLRRLGRKWIRNKRQKIQLQSDFRRAETTSSSGDTSSDSGNIGDCSGPDYDDNVKKRKKVKKGNNKIYKNSGGSVKGNNGGSRSNRGIDDKAGYSTSGSDEIRGIISSGRISGASNIAGGSMCDSSMMGKPGSSGLSGYTGGLRDIDDHGIHGIGGDGSPMVYTTSLSGMGYSEVKVSVGLSGINIESSGITGMLGTSRIGGMLSRGRISISASASSVFGNAGMIGIGGMGSGTINSFGYSSALSSMGYNNSVPVMGASYSGAAMSGMGNGGNYSSISGRSDEGGISNIGYADMGDIDAISSMGDNAAADTSGMGDGVTINDIHHPLSSSKYDGNDSARSA